MAVVLIVLYNCKGSLECEKFKPHKTFCYTRRAVKLFNCLTILGYVFCNVIIWSFCKTFIQLPFGFHSSFSLSVINFPQKLFFDPFQSCPLFQLERPKIKLSIIVLVLCVWLLFGEILSYHCVPCHIGDLFGFGGCTEI